MRICHPLPSWSTKTVYIFFYNQIILIPASSPQRSQEIHSSGLVQGHFGKSEGMMDRVTNPTCMLLLWQHPLLQEVQLPSQAAHPQQLFGEVMRTEVTMSKEASQERICLNGPRKRQGGSSGSEKRLIWEYSFLEKKNCKLLT